MLDSLGYEARIAPVALPSVLLLGGQGSGKTHAIRSLLDAGFEKVVILALEPGINDVLGGTDPKRLHWHYVAPGVTTMSELSEAYGRMHKLDATGMQQLSHLNKQKYQQFIEVMSVCNNFVCDRTGIALGDVTAFPSTWAFVIDGLSGLNTIVQHYSIGIKPFLELRDYSLIQNQLLNFISVLTNDTKCLFVLTAHVALETDETTNLQVLTMDTIGRKLAPKLGRFFSDIILTERVSKAGKVTWRWVTHDNRVQLKTRNLPFSSDLPANFTQLYQSWLSKQERE